jgi:hypothetical protein
MILAAVEAAEQSAETAIEKRRLNDAARQQRAREKRHSHVTSRDVTVTVRDVTPQKVNDPLPSSEPLENNLTKNSPPSGVRIAHTREADAPKSAPKVGQKAACIAALSQVLSPEMADAVWQHRKTKKAELTLKAAELLAGRLTACPDPTAAAELMIERGWQSVNADWVRNASATGPPAGQQQAMRFGRNASEANDGKSKFRDAFARFTGRSEVGASPVIDGNCEIIEMGRRGF